MLNFILGVGSDSSIFVRKYIIKKKLADDENSEATKKKMMGGKMDLIFL